MDLLEKMEIEKRGVVEEDKQEIAGQEKEELKEAEIKRMKL